MMQAFSDWLAETPLSQLLAGLSWFVPAVQTIHILGIAVVVTALLMLDFRLLRLTNGGPALGEMAHNLMPWTWGALGVLLLTGLLLIVTEPARELMSGTFRLKMLMVAALAALTYLFQAALRRDAGYWSASVQRRLLGGALGLISLLLCIGIVAAGRLIAYI